MITQEDTLALLNGVPEIPAANFDIEQYPSELLMRQDIAGDSYFCGFLNEALILCDRNGMVAECQQRVRASWSLAENRQKQLQSIRDSVERNFEEFRVSIETGDIRESCRASILAAWSLCDHMLTDKGVSPGGPRSISRLAVVWREAYDALIDFEAPNPPGDLQACALMDICWSVVEHHL